MRGWTLVVVLGACDGGEAPADDTDDAPTTGTLEVTFRIDDDWGQAVLDDGEALLGPFWGDVFLSDEVTGIGPNPDAVALTSMAYTDVDLSGFDATPVMGTVPELPAGWVTVLGFFDSDGNAASGSDGPDSGDPVTLPNENDFEVVAGETTTVEVFFGFRNP